MRFLLIAFLLAGSAWGQDYEFSENASPEQRETFNYLQNPWSTVGNLDEAFAYVESILKKDSVSAQLLLDVDTTLKAHGIQNLKSIFSFCDEGNSGFFSQGAELVEIKEDGESWSDHALAKQNSGYSSRIVRVPFFEIMYVSETPYICVSKDESIQSVIDVFNHELTHFMKGDTFGLYEQLTKLENIEELYEHFMAGPGGEMDGYKAGIGAEARLLASLGISNPAARYPFLSNDGVVTDDKALREYLDKLYYSYYHEPETLKSQVDFTLYMNEERIRRLQDNGELAKEEIARLEKVNANLRSQLSQSGSIQN